MPKHDLTADQLRIIRDTLAPYAEKIDCVGLFGSRATGTARNNSDIDMVIYGRLDEQLVDRIWSLFDESNLAVKVDINAYHLITYPPLKMHIDSVMHPLLTQADLLKASQ